MAFFGLNSTAFNGNKAWAKEEIARLKQEEGVNAVVFTFHAGQEYGKHRNQAQETYAHYMIDAGADLIIGHHPHVVQGMEIYNNRTICYSLGNFAFGGNKEVRALETVVVDVALTFDDAGNYLGQQLTLYPANISGTYPENNYQPVLVSGDAAQDVMALIQNDTDYELAPYTDEAGCAQHSTCPPSRKAPPAAMRTGTSPWQRSKPYASHSPNCRGNCAVRYVDQMAPFITALFSRRYSHHQDAVRQEEQACPQGQHPQPSPGFHPHTEGQGGHHAHHHQVSAGGNGEPRGPLAGTCKQPGMEPHRQGKGRQQREIQPAEGSSAWPAHLTDAAP